MNHPQQNPLNALDAALVEAIASISYGSVEITIHNGRIVQIEKREKLRASAVVGFKSGPGLPPEG